jgi:hypothetical protein
MPTVISHSTIETLDRALSIVTVELEAALIAGSLFATLALISGIIFAWSLWKHQLDFLCRLCGWQIPLLTTLRLIFTMACFISLVVPTIILYKVLSTVQNLPHVLRVERGAIVSELLGALSCAMIMGVATALMATLN